MRTPTTQQAQRTGAQLTAQEPESPQGPATTIGAAIEGLADGLSIRITAPDGSAAGPADAPRRLHLRTRDAAAYLVTAPGDLGLARAYVSGHMDVEGVHPGDPYDLLVDLEDTTFRRLTPARALTLAQALGRSGMLPPPPPQEEAVPRWRRTAQGVSHSVRRSSEAVSHHYDVSNRFYELVLGPSMTYTCAVYPHDGASLEEAQDNKYRLIHDKLALREGDRLLDVGCGWGGMVRYAARRGVRALGVTLSAEQAQWAQRAIAEEGLGELAEVRHADYRSVTASGFDAVSSIGLTEHIGVRRYPAYFGFLRDRLREGGLLLNHCITRPDNKRIQTGPFIDRYVFPDGELTGSGRIVTAAQDTGLEVVHGEDLREHYARTLAMWCRNLVEHWDECVAEVGEGRARVWGLYMAGSRLAFERNGIQLHHVLAVKPRANGGSGLPLRPWWQP